MPPAPIELVRRSAASVVSLLGAALFVALGLWLLLAPEMPPRTRWIGASNVVFFGLCALVFLAEVRRGPVALRLDAAGIEYRHPDPRQAFGAPWSLVAEVRIEPEERGALVILRFHDPAALPRGAAPEWARRPGAWPPLVPPETSLAASVLGTTPRTLAGEIERFRRYYTRPNPPCPARG